MPEASALSRPVRRRPPGPPGYPFVGALPHLLKNPLQTFMSAVRDYGDIVHLGRRYYLIAHPEYLKHVLQDHARNYQRGFKTASIELVLGNGLFLNEGQSWLQQRRLLQPAFHHHRIEGLTGQIVDNTQGMLERWRQAAHQGQALDIAVEMKYLTQQIIVQTMFGADLTGDELQAVTHAISVIMNYVNFGATLFIVPLWAPTPSNLAFRDAVQVLNRVVYRIINQRRRTGSEANDMLGMLLAAQDAETGIGMSDTQLRDEVMTMFIGGHETTSTALAWTWYLLAQHSQIEQRLYEEVALVLNGRHPTVEDVPRLTYTRMVIEESLRLYPPGWLVDRAAIAADEIGGYPIQPKSFLFISPYVMHRHPAFWSDPDAFDPERFAPEQTANRPRYVFMPFGGGPRQCIGSHLAMLEAELIVAMVVQSYRLHLVPGRLVEPHPRTSLHPRSGVHMTLEYRQ